jgi:hypothetical protein
MFMRNFVQADSLPSSFRENANMQKHRFDCMHNIGPATYCGVCRVYRLSKPVEVPLVFLLDRMLRLPENSIQMHQSEKDQIMVPFALEFMRTPARSNFQVTALYGDWAGWFEERHQDEHAIAASIVVETIPCEGAPESEERFIDEWVNGELLKKTSQVIDFESSFEVDGERFTILSILVGNDAIEFG